MSKASRQAEFVNDKRLNHVPGPNSYTVPAKDKTTRPKWSQSVDKRFIDRNYHTPGPGNYEHRVHTADGPRFTSRPKPFINPFKNRTTTGPGDYNPNVSSVKQFAPAFSMGEKLDARRSFNSPGPGYYDDGR